MRVSLQAPPHPVQLAVQRGIVQFMDPSPGKQHDINGRQPMLLEPDRLPGKPLEAVAIDRTADVSLAEYQAKARMPELVGACQGHQSLAMNLECSVIEDVSIIPGGQQPQPWGKTMTGHVQSAIRRSDACGPWHDGVPGQHDHSW